MSEEKEKDYTGRMDDATEHDRNKDLNIYQRIHAVMSDVWYIQKKESTGQYKTVEHDDVTRKIRPAMIKYGLISFIFGIEDIEYFTVQTSKKDYNTKERYEVTEIVGVAKIEVRIVNIDDPNEVIFIESFGFGKDLDPMTISGKIMSYAYKYAFLKTLQLETGEAEAGAAAPLESDLNVVALFHDIGSDLFGDEWEKMARHKIFSITGGETAEASRAPVKKVAQALRNLYKLKKQKDANPDKDIGELDKKQEKEKNGDDDILSEFD